MKRILVTGGSGFIGSHVVDKLAAAGYAPRIFDLQPSPHHDPERVDMVVGDLLDSDALRAAMEGCDAVIHLAASADVGIVVKEPEEAEQANARGTLAVLEAARAVGVKRVVYGSTIWVYGDSGEGTLDEDTLLGLPGHLYTASKLAGEMYCTSYAELYGIEYTILRFGIPYGPRARGATVIPIFIRKALAGESLTIAGDGMQTRRFVYVEDLADCVVRGLEPCAVNRVYNLASDETVTIRQVAELVGEAVGSVGIVHTPGRSGDFEGAEISSRRAAEELGWHAATPLRDGVRQYLTWLREEEPRTQAPAAEPAAEPARLPLRERILAGTPVALACFVGTLLPYMIALRWEGLSTAQEHSVGITAPVAILVIASMVTSVGARVRVAATVLATLYLALISMPWSRDALNLARPHDAAFLLIVLGVVMALGLVASVNRFRAASSPAADRAT